MLQDNPIPFQRSGWRPMHCTLGPNVQTSYQHISFCITAV